MRITTQTIVMGAAGVVIGASALLGVRYFTYNPGQVHYHANFDIYINGQREAFANPMYYEEEGGGSCTLETEMTPGERAHMHDNIGDVVHVEDHAVTWGNFFQNLHWTVNDKLVQTPDKVYLADDTNKITFLINGREVQDISSETIHDKDRLLVDFGSASQADLQKEYKAVPATAAKYDEGKDPAGCMGNATPGFRERMRHMF